MNYINILMVIPVLLISVCYDNDKSENQLPSYLNIVKCNESTCYMEKDSGLKRLTQLLLKKYLK